MVENKYHLSLIKAANLAAFFMLSKLPQKKHLFYPLSLF
jgi:hypothetical protein